MTKQHLALALVLVGIVSSIWYLDSLKVSSAPIPTVTEGNEDAYKEIVDPSGFINTEPFEIADLIGKKVILVDFWTYSCINCQRTQPYLNAWYDKYQANGLEIIGIHTPEFDFEKDLQNVQDAVSKFGIKYPVVLDNNQGTWYAYQNRYWPHKYLIDLNGKIVYDHIGEGGYDETEVEIQKLLGATGDMSTVTAIDVDFNKVNSPETYFGASRNELLANGEIATQGVQTFTLPTELESNQLYLDGTWDFTEEYAETQTDEAGVAFNYDAKNVYMVASAPNGGTLEVYVDGVLVKSIEVKEEELYQLVEGADYGKHHLEIKVKGKGLKAFTFTFG